MYEKENIIQKNILSCMENVGIDAELILDGGMERSDIFSMIDSLQYISFIAEVEDVLNVKLLDEFLTFDSFKTFQELIIKLEYYVKGWNESYHNNFSKRGGEKDEEDEEIKKDV